MLRHEYAAFFATPSGNSIEELANVVASSYARTNIAEVAKHLINHHPDLHALIQNIDLGRLSQCKNSWKPEFRRSVEFDVPEETIATATQVLFGAEIGDWTQDVEITLEGHRSKYLFKKSSILGPMILRVLNGELHVAFGSQQQYYSEFEIGLLARSILPDTWSKLLKIDSKRLEVTDTITECEKSVYQTAIAIL